MKKIFENFETEVLIVDNFQDLSWEIGKFGRNVLWVFDSNTSLMVRPLPEPNVILQAGRESRKYESVNRILEEAYENKMNKDSIFLSFGGRSVSDITSFASSIWMYKSRFVCIPTTLCSFLESSIGQRHGIDFKSTKDSVGVNHAPEKSILCLNLLKSLSTTNYTSGLAYLIKYSFLSDDEQFAKKLVTEKTRILEKDLACMQSLIETSLNVRFHYLDNGNEKLLSFGKIFANALSYLYYDRFSDGQALAWGLATAAKISLALNICSSQFTNHIIHTLQSYGFDTEFKINRAQWMEMRSFFNKEKNISDGRISLILPLGQGELKVLEVEEETVKKQVMQDALL